MRPLEVSVALWALLTLFGCAKFPEQPLIPPSEDRLIIRLWYAAPLEPEFFYFIAVDDDGDPTTGPLPALTSPWGNGWGVPEGEGSRIRLYVEVHRQSAEIFRIIDPNPTAPPRSLGKPLEFVTLQPGEAQIVLDLRQIFPAFPDEPRRIELNFISVDEIILDQAFEGRRNYDALGPTGNDFISIPLTATQTFRNGEGFVTETSGDATLDALDLVDWEVQVILGQR